MNVSQIYLREVATGKAVPASLCDEITDEHLEMWDRTWRPVFDAHCQGLPPDANKEDFKWNWKGNATIWRSGAEFNSFAVVCDGALQGLMVTNNVIRARLTAPAKKHLIYVELLATAPWNRPNVQSPPRYRFTGWILILAAIELSLEMEFRGRIGLHSLPRAEPFYRDKCEMTPVERDADHNNMMYFEMTEKQAEAFRQKRMKP